MAAAPFLDYPLDEVHTSKFRENLINSNDMAAWF
jgi:hypothetical protein